MDKWSCQKCGAEGGFLMAVFRVIYRHPIEPAEDKIECKTCGNIQGRYSGKNPKGKGEKCK